MNDTLCRGAWDKGCTDIMYMIIEYPNYPIISLLTSYLLVIWVAHQGKLYHLTTACNAQPKEIKLELSYRLQTVHGEV